MGRTAASPSSRWSSSQTVPTFLPARSARASRCNVDSGVRAGDTITHFYDPLLAKVVAWGSDRTAAITAMRDALDGYRIEGVKTNIPLHQRILTHPGFVDGTYDVTLLTHPSWGAREPWKSARR